MFTVRPVRLSEIWDQNNLSDSVARKYQAAQEALRNDPDKETEREREEPSTQKSA